MPLTRRPGQTLLEMIIAIAVITIATLASTTLIISTIVTGRTSQARIEAGNLAREGVEVIRGIRDSNWLKADQNVLDGLDPSVDTTVTWDDTGSVTDGPVPIGSSSGNNYIATFIPTLGQWTLTTRPTSTCSVGDSTTTVYKKSQAISGKTTFFYTQSNPCSSGCTATSYHRVIKVTSATENVTFGGGFPSSIGYLLVESTVCGGRLTKPIVATERLYNWK